MEVAVDNNNQTMVNNSVDKVTQALRFLRSRRNRCEVHKQPLKVFCVDQQNNPEKRAIEILEKEGKAQYIKSNSLTDEKKTFSYKMYKITQ